MDVLKVTFVGRHVPSAQSWSRHKKLHNDLTKPGDICKNGQLSDIQLCPKKHTATAAEKTTFDCAALENTFSIRVIHLSTS